MRKTRIFTETSLSVGQVVTVDSDAAHHLVNVLRLKPGQAILAFNGKGGCYECEIVDTARRSLVIRPVLFSGEENDSPLKLTLAQGISRGQHMDYTVQKAVELGISSIIPLFTSFSNVKLDGNRARKRRNHWQKIVTGACEQSGRNIVPEVADPLDFSDWVKSDSGRLRLILDPDADTSLSGLATESHDITLLCGPEGGLSDVEVAVALASGYQSVSLGPRILRTETAALAAIAICQSRWGDI